MRRSWRWLPLVIAAGLLSGCGLLAAQLATQFSLSVEPEELTAARDGSEEVVVGVSRPLGIDLTPIPVILTLHRAPDGVSLGDVDEVQIPSGIDEETISLHVSADAELGEHEVVFRGTNTVRTEEATLTLTIVDAP